LSLTIAGMTKVNIGDFSAEFADGSVRICHHDASGDCALLDSLPVGDTLTEAELRAVLTDWLGSTSSTELQRRLRRPGPSVD
jgi:hypothetical protein